MRVLVVDDEEQVAELLAIVIRGEGNEAHVALSGAEALRVLESTAFDGVFLDLKMPDMDGLEVLSRLRELHPGVPVVVLSGHADEQHIREAEALGAVDVVHKPAQLNALVDAVARLRSRES